MNNDKGYVKWNIVIGQWIYSFFLLQVLSIFYTIKGGIILGFFPAVSSVCHVFYNWIHHKKFDLSVSREFQSFYNQYFWETNKLGWIMTGLGLLLGIDYYVSRQFIQSIPLHYILLIIIVIYLSVLFYLFPVFARYNLKTIEYIKQAFFISFSSMSQTIAVLLATFLVSYFFNMFPFLFLFFGVPLLLGPIVWFTHQGMLRVEKSK